MLGLKDELIMAIEEREHSPNTGQFKYASWLAMVLTTTSMTVVRTTAASHPMNKMGLGPAFNADS
eukprot:6205825-Pleurochrysis_carterae.AAC.4